MPRRSSAEDVLAPTPVLPDGQCPKGRRIRRLSMPVMPSFAIGIGDDEVAEASSRYVSSRSFNSQATCEFSKPKLDRIKLFQECTPCFLEALYHQLENEVFDTGTEIIRQGDIGTCMYLLNFGEVEVIIGESDEFVTTLHSGSMFGEMAVISKNPAAAKRTATIRAKSMCHCWRIDRPSLLKLFSVYPKDEAVISSEADRRLQDLVDKGLVHLPEKKHPYRQLEAATPRRRSLRSLKTVSTLKVDHFDSDGDLGLERVPTISTGISCGSERYSQSSTDCSSPRHVLPSLDLKVDNEPPQPPRRMERQLSKKLTSEEPPQPPRRVERQLSKKLTSEVACDLMLYNSETAQAQVCRRGERRDSKSWQIGQTSEVKRIRNSVHNFLAKRGIMS